MKPLEIEDQHPRAWPAPRIDAVLGRAYRAWERRVIERYGAWYADREKERHPTRRYSAKSLALALPPGEAELEPLLGKPHLYATSARSSQVLLVGLLGAAQRQRPDLAWLTEAIGLDLGAGPHQLSLERQLHPDDLGERPRQTALDALIEGPEIVVCLEAKWTEKELGRCSCAKGRTPAERGDHRVGHDCSRRVRERHRYWEAAAAMGLPEARDPGRDCLLHTTYQGVRNVAAARVLANGRRAVFCLLWSRANPAFAGVPEIGWPGWSALMGTALEPTPDVTFHSLTWEDLVPRLPLPENVRAWARDKHGL